MHIVTYALWSLNGANVCIRVEVEQVWRADDWCRTFDHTACMHARTLVCTKETIDNNRLLNGQHVDAVAGSLQ